METQKSELALQTAEILKVYLARNDVSGDDLPTLIGKVANALGNVGNPTTNISIAAEQTPEMRQNLNRALVERTTQEPAVPIEDSVHPDYIVCLEDGVKMKVLKRHLRQHGLTPDTYRLKWGLPADYPLVAPNYAKQRSNLAKKFGLGSNRGNPEPAVSVAAPAPAEKKARKSKPKASKKKEAGTSEQNGVTDMVP